MRTNIVIDDKLIEEGLEYTGFKTKKELVNFALKKLVERKKKKSIIELEGKRHWAGDLEEMRNNRFEGIS
ncbi:MAG: type II toxin-antitoxin system VapB family antitoxin [Anaerolineales bacterium]|nr:type II toxin-antitoxin system VapB family antitoxin [Anaerolineales bacterium]